jgi:ankyrin repeat protein
LEKGADINVLDHSGWNCLMYACHSGNDDAAQRIVEHGIHLGHKNKDGMTALMFACRYKRRNIFDLIFEQCGDDRHYLNSQDDMGYTALMWACVNTPDPYIIRKLVKKGADVSLRTIHGSTALHLAYEYGSDDNTLAMLMP